MKRDYTISEGSTWLFSIFFVLGAVIASDRCDKILNMCLKPKKESDFWLILILTIVLALIGILICWVAFLCYQEFLVRQQLKLHDLLCNKTEEEKLLTKNVETYAGYVFIDILLYSVIYRVIHAFDRELSLVARAPFKSLIGVLIVIGYAFYVGYIYRGYLSRK